MRAYLQRKRITWYDHARILIPSNEKLIQILTLVSRRHSAACRAGRASGEVDPARRAHEPGPVTRIPGQAGRQGPGTWHVPPPTRGRDGAREIVRAQRD